MPNLKSKSRNPVFLHAVISYRIFNFLSFGFSLGFHRNKILPALNCLLLSNIELSQKKKKTQGIFHNSKLHTNPAVKSSQFVKVGKIV